MVALSSSLADPRTKSHCLFGSLQRRACFSQMHFARKVAIKPINFQPFFTQEGGRIGLRNATKQINSSCRRAPCLSTPVPFSCATARVARHRCCPLSGAVLCEARAQNRLVVRSLFCGVVSLCRNEKKGGPPLRTAMGRRKMGGTVAMCKRILPALRRESKGVVVEYPWQEPGTATAVMQDRREELLRMNLVINPALRKVIA